MSRNAFAALAVASLLRPVLAAPEELSRRQAEVLLRQADFASQAPRSLRARIRFATAARRAEVEVFRTAGLGSAVRFLGPKERGKWLVYRDGVAWFVAPGAKKPVKLPPAYRLSGEVSIDDLLGTAYSADYEIVSARSERETSRRTAVLDLVATAPRAPYPRARLVVDYDTGRPAQIEYYLASGRPAKRAIFEAFTAGPPPHPSRIRLEDTLRKGKVTTIEIVEVEARAIPDTIFDPQDSGARRALESAAALAPR